MFSVPHLTLITVIVVTSNVIGLFGNLNVIIATIRCSSLRTKAGYLMMILCCLQTVCLLSEFANLRVYWRRMAMAQAVCFRMISVYLFSTIAQSLMYFMLSLDMLIAVAAPLKHRLWPTTPYVILMCIPPAIIAGAAWTASYLRSKSGDVSHQACRPPTAVVHEVIMAFTILLMIANTGAIIMVVVLAVIVRRKEKEMKGTRHRKTTNESSSKNVPSSSTHKMVRVLSIVVAVFVCTWYFCVVSVHIALRLKLKEQYMDYIMTFNLVPAMLSYCQNYFVLWIRSPRHRRAFKEQIACLRSCSFKSTNRRSSSSHSTGKSRRSNAYDNTESV